jgi:hypothetical protein
MQPERPIIGVCGFAEEGKSTIARILEERFKLSVVKFAGPLKDMLRAIGLDESELEGSKKLLPCDKLGGQTPRHAMQTLGTEWGRCLVSDTLWTGLWRIRAAEAPTGAVADDLRFLNEEAAIRDAGGLIIRVIRPGLEHRRGKHVSETQHLGIKEDATVYNDGSLAALADRVVRVMNAFGFPDRSEWAA